MVGADREQLIAQTVNAMARSTPDVLVTMDYWTFDGYLSIAEYETAHPGALGGKTIFPGIELRVESSLKKRLNVHLVLDPNVSPQALRDVLAVLKINLRDGDRSLSEECLIQHSRELGPDRLDKGSFDQKRVATDDEYALEVGWQTAMITQESLREALKVMGDRGLLLMPWDTYGGLSEIDWVAHYAEVRRFRTAADIFECKDEGNRLAFHGVKNALNEKYFENFWASLDSTARLCVRGTDAHSFANYGKFPSNMKTWIKAETTFQGLRHAIKEPVFRSYIGDVPPNLITGETSILRENRQRKNGLAPFGQIRGTKNWSDITSVNARRNNPVFETSEFSRKERLVFSAKLLTYLQRENDSFLLALKKTNLSFYALQQLALIRQSANYILHNTNYTNKYPSNKYE